MRAMLKTEKEGIHLMKPKMVEKDTIALLHFPKEDVLHHHFDKAQRIKDLEQAMFLGNVYHEKVKITFEDIEGRKQVLTTIWTVTEDQIVLKKDVTIPIHRIVTISY